jgi:Holliday junction resolvase RusA-like endonuclease
MSDPLRTVEVRIEGRPPTPNARRHWRQVSHDNRVWKEAALRSAQDVRNRSAVFGRPIAAADMTVTFVVPDRMRRDPDNLIAATKPLTDGLVAAGILADDSFTVLRSVTYVERYERGLEATVYTIRELEPDQLEALP